MCLLCVMQPNETPTREQLKIAAVANPHGFGYAFHVGDRIITGRGMDADEVIDRFLRIREGLPNTWAMFHARITTHGQTNKANCHPFRMNGDPSTVIGHNGIIPIEVDKADHRSDTRIFADEWLPELLTELDDEKGFKELEDLVGYSKVAIFTHDERLQHQVYILNEDLGHWTGGIWWSNDSYEPFIPKSYGYARGSYSGSFFSSYEDKLGKDLPDSCYECGSIVDQRDKDVSLCPNCQSCLDCYADFLSCLCYNPAAAAKRDKYESEMYYDTFVTDDGTVYSTSELMPYGGWTND